MGVEERPNTSIKSLEVQTFGVPGHPHVLRCCLVAAPTVRRDPRLELPMLHLPLHPQHLEVMPGAVQGSSEDKGECRLVEIVAKPLIQKQKVSKVKEPTRRPHSQRTRTPRWSPI